MLNAAWGRASDRGYLPLSQRWELPDYYSSTSLVLHFPVLTNWLGNCKVKVNHYTVIQYLEMGYTEKGGKPITKHVQRQLQMGISLSSECLTSSPSAPLNFTERIKTLVQSQQPAQFLSQGRAVNTAPEPPKENADTTSDESDSARPLPEICNAVILYWR